jgi:trigger factor
VQEYLQMTGVTPEQMQNDLREQADHRVREELALEALFRAQKIEITDTDLDDAVREIAGGDESAAATLRDNLATNGALPIVREQIMHRKALKWLIDSVTVVEEEQS